VHLVLVCEVISTEILHDVGSFSPRLHDGINLIPGPLSDIIHDAAPTKSHRLATTKAVSVQQCHGHRC
jgi:hypothetical protein